MTGKDLLLVLACTAAFAGVGGVGAALVMRDQPPLDAGTDQALLDRLEQIDRSIQETNATMASNGDAIGGLRSRMEAVESGLRAPRAASGTVRPGRVDVRREHGAAGIDGEYETGRPIDLGSELGELPEGIREEVAKKLADAMERLGGGIKTGGGSPQLGTLFSDGGTMQILGDRLGSLAKSLELRQLSEEERWERARDEVGLNEVQVGEIQTAIDERDEALRAAMNVERDEETGTGHVTVRRMDVEKAREANATYEKRVDTVLNDQQKKSWKDGGFADAFGKSSSGAVSVISIGTVREIAPGEPVKTRR